MTKKQAHSNKEMNSLIKWLVLLPFSIFNNNKLTTQTKTLLVSAWVLCAGVLIFSVYTLGSDYNLASNTQAGNIDTTLYSVTKIVDGDTIAVEEIGTLRLIGMDTPETKDPRKPVQCFGQEASNRAVELLEGEQVYLEYDPKNETDKYGRTLAYVYRSDGYFYNLEMVRDGFAHSYTQFDHPRIEQFNEAQRVAIDNELGFWSDETCSGDTTQSAE